jgi:acetoacetyl-CoA synthetase
MKNALWTPSKEHIEATQMFRFQKTLEEKFDIRLENHQALHQWSIDNSEDFWEAVWNFGEIKSSSPYSAVLEDGKKFPGAKWFPGSRL